MSPRQADNRLVAVAEATLVDAKELGLGLGLEPEPEPRSGLVVLLARVMVVVEEEEAEEVEEEVATATMGPVRSMKGSAFMRALLRVWITR